MIQEKPRFWAYVEYEVTTVHRVRTMVPIYTGVHAGDLEAVAGEVAVQTQRNGAMLNPEHMELAEAPSVQHTVVMVYPSDSEGEPLKDDPIEPVYQEGRLRSIRP